KQSQVGARKQKQVERLLQSSQWENYVLSVILHSIGFAKICESIEFSSFQNQIISQMKAISQLELIKSVRKHTVFIGKAYGSPKGAKGYKRNKQKENWRKEI
ncbi:MAG: hypothetical protein Q7S72_01465, partial [Candidatus Taylorbacteria bacterium]|nr:hypothetical protein [Candidatus Taylorbacteria bacterium]